MKMTFRCVPTFQTVSNDSNATWVSRSVTSKYLVKPVSIWYLYSTVDDAVHNSVKTIVD